MGWLRDLMGASEPKVQSYGELARRCLEHEHWPLDIQPQARSLASLYSKFDRGIEVEWLHDRPEVQVVLASVLHLPPTTLEGAVKKHVASADQQLSRWRLRDVPQARPIDLREEGLPTVFPDVLLRPGSWHRLWWSEGAHHGAELVGRWLAARALSEFAVCFDWQELEARVAVGTAPLMVLYWGAVSATNNPLFASANRPLCVVGRGGVPAGFEAVETLALERTEHAMLEWVSGLMPIGSDAAPAALSAWLRLWASDGVELDFDTIAGLTATVLQLGLTESVPLATLAERYLSHRLDQAEDAGTREAKWLRQHGLALPIGITKNAIRRAGNLPWDIPRTKTEWLELVPDEYQRGVDADWTRVSLQRAGTPLTVAELERALRQVPPGGFRVLATLCDAHLLQEVADAKFTFYPRWFAQYLESAAYAALVDDTPDEWGQVGLVHSRTPRLLNALEKHFANGHQAALDAVVELDELSPPTIAALELMVVATGRSLLRGVELDGEQITALVKRQAEVVLERLPVFGSPYSADSSDVPRPRLLCLTRERGMWGEWLTALWALTEQFEGSDAEVSASLNPWTLSPILPRSGLALVETLLASLPQNDARVAATYSLLGRLLQHLERARDEANSPTERTALTELAGAPLFAVAKVLRGDGWPAWQQALTVPHGVESVKALVAPEAWQYLAKTAWRTWLEKGADEVGVQLFTQTPARRKLFWPHLPDRVLQSLLDARNPLVLLVPADCMKDEWVTMYLERVPEARDLAVQYLEVIPPEAIVDEHLEVLFELLERHALVERAAPLFQNHAHAALTRLTTLLDQGRITPASVWLAAVPQSSRAAVFAHLKKCIEQRGSSYAAFGLCRSWLAELCAARAADWLEAYPLLEECEQRLRRVTRAFASVEPSASE